MLGEKILIEINVISLTQNITTLDQYDTESGVDADMKGHTIGTGSLKISIKTVTTPECQSRQT